MNVNLKSLVGKLNETGRKALEAAAGLCVTRTHYDIDIEHVLLKLVEAENTDIQKILRHYEVDQARLTRDLTRAVDRFKTGNARTPAFSPRIPRWVTEAWNLASIDFGASKIRSGHLLIALLGDEDLGRLARDASSELRKVSVEESRKNLPDLTAGSAEEVIESSGTGESSEPGPNANSKTPGLDQFTIDLTERARKGHIDPVLGRDFEIRQMVDILTRRRQNNPILTGEAGVGKTAVVEGLALRIAAGDVPPPLHQRGAQVARLNAVAGRSGRQRRVREPAEVGHRGSQRFAAADHPVHRRSAHDDRRRRSGGAGRCREYSQAGAGARRAAHHRRDDLVGIQKIFREGCRADAALSGRQSRRADRGASDRDDARIGRYVRDAPQRAHSG